MRIEQVSCSVFASTAHPVEGSQERLRIGSVQEFSECPLLPARDKNKSFLDDLAHRESSSPERSRLPHWPLEIPLHHQLFGLKPDQDNGVFNSSILPRYVDEFAKR